MVSGGTCSSVGRSIPCGQMGRLVQYCTSRTVPITPASTHSRRMRTPSPVWPWFPICVDTFVFAACAFSVRTSVSVRASGFWQ